MFDICRRVRARSASIALFVTIFIVLPLTTAGASEGFVSPVRPGAEIQEAIPEDLEYEVVNEDVFRDDRRSLDVRLSRKVSEEALTALARKLEGGASQDFDRTFIVYYLPDMKIDAGGWATTHFTPDLEVEVLGLPAGKDSRVQEAREKYGESLIGVWENNQPGSAATFVLFETGMGFGLEEIFSDGSSRTIQLQEQPADDGRRFKDPENTVGEYWMLRNGRLELHDPMGVVFTARPIDG